MTSTNELPVLTTSTGANSVTLEARMITPEKSSLILQADYRLTCVGLSFPTAKPVAAPATRLGAR